MRRTILLVAGGILALTACGGSDAISTGDLDKERDAADDVARKAVAALVTDLDAAPPSPDSLGRGLYAGCDGGDPDQASYFIDTFVTYDGRPADEAAAEAEKALDDAGLPAQVDAATNTLSVEKAGVSIDLSSQEKGGGSAGQNIFVSTGCLAVGKNAIAAFNAENGRPVRP